MFTNKIICALILTFLPVASYAMVHGYPPIYFQPNDRPLIQKESQSNKTHTEPVKDSTVKKTLKLCCDSLGTLFEAIIKHEDRHYPDGSPTGIPPLDFLWYGLCCPLVEMTAINTCSYLGNKAYKMGGHILGNCMRKNSPKKSLKNL